MLGDPTSEIVGLDDLARMVGSLVCVVVWRVVRAYPLSNLRVLVDELIAPGQA